MKLSGAVEQACCIMAISADPQRKAPMTNDVLAEKMLVSPTYLKKISRKLVVAKLITSTQGAGGGFILAREMGQVTLHDVVLAIEGEAPFFQPQGIVERVFASRSRQVEIGMTMIEKVFSEAQEKWSEYLKTVTLEDVVKEVMHG